jgi:hypothetical protein
MPNIQSTLVYSPVVFIVLSIVIYVLFAQEKVQFIKTGVPAGFIFASNFRNIFQAFSLNTNK